MTPHIAVLEAPPVILHLACFRKELAWQIILAILNFYLLGSLNFKATLDWSFFITEWLHSVFACFFYFESEAILF
jgi:hypothetical protein